MNRRSKVLIEPRFQSRFVTRLSLWVFLSTLITGMFVFGFLQVADERSAGDFFYVVQETGTHPIMLSRTQIILPALLISLFVNLVLTLGFALTYSQRLAGPIHRMIRELTKLERGDKMKATFHLRGSDEFQDLGMAFDAALKRLSHDGYIKEK